MSRLRDIHKELQRRKVYRVAVVYAAVAFIVGQVADIAFEPLGLPAVAMTLVLALIVLGLPLALVLAWAYEVHPDPGMEARAAASRDSSPPDRREDPGSDRDPSSISASTSPDPARAGHRTVAVLPFENMSPEPESEYFADGISEELTHALGRIPALRVAARTSAFSFKGQRVDVREIGRRLSVEHVVEGSVRRSGARLRVTAQLVDSRNGYHVWSDRYEREMDDVFAIQDEIVAAVVESLQARLEAGEGRTPQASRTGVSAYDLFLQAKHALRAFDGAPVKRALGLVEEALELDPQFAPSHALRAEVLTTQALGFFQGPKGDLLAKARASAEQALALEPDLPEAHLAHALTLIYHDWRYLEARGALDRALDLNASFVDAHRWSEFYWTYVERDYEKAMAALAAARTLDPVDRRIDLREATVEYLFERYHAAESILRGLLEEDPSLAMARLGLMDTLFRAARKDEAAALAAQFSLGEEAPDVFLGVAGLILAGAGRRKEAKRRLVALKERGARGYVHPFWRAMVHAGLGELEEAFRLLDQAVDERDGGLLFLAAVPEVPGFQDDPRFARILGRIGLAHLAHRHGTATEGEP